MMYVLAIIQTVCNVISVLCNVRQSSHAGSRPQKCASPTSSQSVLSTPATAHTQSHVLSSNRRRPSIWFWFTVAILLGDLVGVVWEWRSGGPVSRWSILQINLAFAQGGLVLLMYLIDRFGGIFQGPVDLPPDRAAEDSPGKH
jgi:hypothetical protein